MTHDLLHGDLAAAVVDNVFLLVGLPHAGWPGFWCGGAAGSRLMPMPAIVVIGVAARHLDGGAEPARVPAGPDASRRVAPQLR